MSGQRRKEYIDEVGNRYGRLVVIEHAGTRKRKAIWRCGCDCGKEIIAIGNNLRTGRTQSCGCLQSERAHTANALPKGVAASNEILGRYKRRAKKHGLVWGLTKVQFIRLTQRACHYCGASPAQIFSRDDFNGDFIYNGLDRADNTRGYTLDNAVPCCGTCNKAKLTRIAEEYKAWIHRSHEHLVGI